LGYLNGRIGILETHALYNQGNYGVGFLYTAQNDPLGSRPRFAYLKMDSTTDADGKLGAYSTHKTTNWTIEQWGNGGPPATLTTYANGTEVNGFDYVGGDGSTSGKIPSPACISPMNLKSVPDCRKMVLVDSSYQGWWNNSYPYLKPAIRSIDVDLSEDIQETPQEVCNKFNQSFNKTNPIISDITDNFVVQGNMVKATDGQVAASTHKIPSLLGASCVSIPANLVNNNQVSGDVGLAHRIYGNMFVDNIDKWVAGDRLLRLCQAGGSPSDPSGTHRAVGFDYKTILGGLDFSGGGVVVWKWGDAYQRPHTDYKNAGAAPARS
jgi:hypothetical protein